MGLYHKLLQRAWRSGEYAARPEGPGGDRGGAEDGEALRPLLRSKMEWIVERESYAPEGEQRQEAKMKLAQYVKFREEKFGGVLFETRSEKVFTLSPTGAAVVKEIVAGGGDQDIVARLKARYEDKTGGLEKEATEFIAQLKSQGLVTE